MSVKTLPRSGEHAMPTGVKIAKVTVGYASTNDVAVTAQTTYPIFNVKAGMLVLNVLANVNTAFTTSVTLNIGDGTDTDGFLATAKIAPQSAVTSGILKTTSVATAEAFAGGRLYTADDTIDVVVAGATPVAGQMDVYVVYVDPSNI